MIKGSIEIALIVEDAYGGEFFRRVFNAVNERGIIKRKIRLKKLKGRKNPIHAPYLCNPKLNKIIKALDISMPDMILLIYDGDGPSNYKKRLEEAKNHIPCGIRTPIKVFLFEYEIEEWICKSLGLRWTSKPSDELKRRFNYQKFQLPKYAEKLDFEKLKRNCTSFNEFLKVLGD